MTRRNQGEAMVAVRGRDRTRLSMRQRGLWRTASRKSHARHGESVLWRTPSSKSQRDCKSQVETVNARQLEIPIRAHWRQFAVFSKVRAHVFPHLMVPVGPFVAAFRAPVVEMVRDSPAGEDGGHLVGGA